MFGTRLSVRNGSEQKFPRIRGNYGGPGLRDAVRHVFGSRILGILNRDNGEIESRHHNDPPKSSSVPAPTLRPVNRADMDRICDFLHRHWPRIDARTWRNLFDYAWLEDKPNLGFVLTVDDEIVGFQGTVYAHRRIGDKSGLVCNPTAWCVLPEYRGWSVALAMAALRDQSISYRNPTSAPEMVRFFERLRFTRLDVQRIAMPPLLHAETLFARGARFVFDPLEIRTLLDDDQRRIFDDHASYDCLQLALVDGHEASHFVVKRRTMRRLPVSELFYCSAPDLFVRHLERVKLAILRRQRTLALVAEAPLLRPHRPRGLSIPRVVLVRSPIFDAEEIDNLYSELVLLPI